MKSTSEFRSGFRVSVLPGVVVGVTGAELFIHGVVRLPTLAMIVFLGGPAAGFATYRLHRWWRAKRG